MIKQLYNKILSWLKASTYQTEIDKFVTSKRPTSLADVEHWMRNYEFNQKGKL